MRLLGKYITKTKFHFETFIATTFIWVPLTKGGAQPTMWSCGGGLRTVVWIIALLCKQIKREKSIQIRRSRRFKAMSFFTDILVSQYILANTNISVLEIWKYDILILASAKYQLKYFYTGRNISKYELKYRPNIGI